MKAKSYTDTYTIKLAVERMTNSRNGNPRYAIYHEGCCDILATTRPDCSLAYGKVPNNAGLWCIVTIRHMPSGRCYVEDIAIHPTLN